jgi:hypothetical protein
VGLWRLWGAVGLARELWSCGAVGSCGGCGAAEAMEAAGYWSCRAMESYRLQATGAAELWSCELLSF